MARHIDLNADLGEGVTDDAALLAIVTSANVACGYHAGSDEIMRAVCEQAAERGVSVGAQVSYADREHFGRVARDVAPDVLRDQVADQVETLSSIAGAAGTRVRYVKPHGALYHRVLDDEAQAAAVLEGSGSLPVLGMPGALLRGAERAGRGVLLEGFPDGWSARDVMTWVMTGPPVADEKLARDRHSQHERSHKGDDHGGHQQMDPRDPSSSGHQAATGLLAAASFNGALSAAG